MKVILGLGNPGREYEQTRHNVGWWVLDHLADVWRLDGWRRDGETMTLGGTVLGQPVVDEVAIPIGTYRVRARGSAGGHNGLKDIERALGSQEYPRLRVGIAPTDPRRRGDLSNFVLGKFASDERAIVLDLMPRFQDAIEIWLRDGILKAMNAHNGDAKGLAS